MRTLFPLLLVTATIASAADRPNILWLTSEDNSVDWIGCYGNPHAHTPCIDALAREGVQYTRCYANAPVCAPMRSTWITGVHALSMGTHPMTSRYPIPHETIKYYPDLLKQAGYFVGNVTKTDYNIGGRDDDSVWDTRTVDWKELKERQPFFLVINSIKSHESKAFGDVTHTNHNPEDVRLARYHPDIPGIRNTYAHYHDQITKMDADIGRALADLQASGMADNTIVIYNSDHGGVLPRSKRFLFDSGTHCPLIIRIPDAFSHVRPAVPGSKVDDLVSFIDMPKTWLTLCGAETPASMQGKVFLGPDKETREYHVSYRGRMDERCDNSRAIRDRRFLYIRNYMPYAPWGQHLRYLWRMEATQAWEQHHREGKTDAITGRFFHTKPMEELYDTSIDRDNVHNLIDDPAYAKEVSRLRAALDQWQREYFDAGLLPETEMVRRSEALNTTIYDMVRDPSQYDVTALQSAAALALQQDPTNLPTFYENLGSDDVGLRYWAIMGCFHLQGLSAIDMDLIRDRLDDDSHHVRIMAAWILYRDGDRATAQACWNDLLEHDSYASLMIFNIIDWIGDGIDPYKAAMRVCGFRHGGYVDRMKEYFGIPPKAHAEKTTAIPKGLPARAKGADPVRPNILFAIADDWGVHAGAYGTRWVKTPSFDRVAREGVLFTNAYTPMAKCAPSRACVLTGRHLWQNEEAGNHLAYFPTTLTSWPEALMERGWHVGFTGKGWGPGIANDADGKARLIVGKPFQQQTAEPPTSGISRNDYAANFRDFLDAASADTPWCFWFGANEPHRGYEFQSGVNKGGKRLKDVDRVPGYWPDRETVRHDMLDYAFEVEHVDRHLGRMMDELERRGLLENTMIVFTSDHGMPFPRVKGYAYRDSNRVPLAVRWPGAIEHPGRTVIDFVDFTDLAATFLDYAGISQADSGMRPITGRSWRPILESNRSDDRIVPERDHVLIGKERTDVGRPNNGGYPIRGIVTTDFLYLHNDEPSRWPAGNPETGYLDTDGSPTKTLILELGRKDRSDRFWHLNFGVRPAEELYDLSADPDCTCNLASDPSHAARMAELRERMERTLKSQGDPRMFGRGHVFDDYPPASGDGFYEKFMRGEKVRAGWVNETDFENQAISP